MSSLLRTTNHVNASIMILIGRLGFGGLMLTHGYPKLQKLITGDWQFGDPLGLGVELSLITAVFSEFICALLIIFGLYTRLASIPLIITMATAAFVVHGADPLGQKEKALLYLVVFTGLLFSGAGKYSLDKRL